MGEYLTAHPVLPDREAERLDAEAAVRVTVGQHRAALAVLDDRAGYATLDELAAALALAVLTAEDDKARSVVCVLEPGGAFYVFGPYATHAAATKAAASGLATREGARGGVFPLIPAPKAAKKAAPKRSTRAARPAA